MAQKRYLTKSRFKLAEECPTKLFYTGKACYANQKLDDSFLLALADGGFQVGELAKCYFPGGTDITALDHSLALKQTNELLKRDQVTVYEAAVSTKTLFIRVDILVKAGNKFSFYEVKAKSFNPEEKNLFLNSQGSIKSAWKPYLYDTAFQKYVIKKAFPNYEVTAFLMMADKSAKCPVEGLNQKFFLSKDKLGRKSVSVMPSLGDADLTPPILCRVNVDRECDYILGENDDSGNRSARSFAERVKLFAGHYTDDSKIPPQVSIACRDCEFTATESDEHNGLKNGRKECWKEALNWTDSDFSSQTVLDIWNFRKKSRLIQSGRIKMSDLTQADISPKSDNKPGLSASERQWMQVKKYQANDQSIWIDRANLQREMDSWIFPLHFIDFETAMVAIPFNKGRRPYEGMAFQFSHHVVYANDIVEHKSEYLHTKQSNFSNYDFLRHLKVELDKDNGSIFSYSRHENTFLNIIYRQLQTDSSAIGDGKELSEFVRLITQSTTGSVDNWVGARNMIDMLEIVKRYYYDPATKGSNSIKHVLPALLNKSKILQEKYSKPIYGAPNGIKSLNFKDWQWVQFDSDNVVDPYKLLPKMFQDVTDKDWYRLSDEDELSSGGAALTAYAKLQFEIMSEYERRGIRKGLLKYCELDTMAMVMLYEGLKGLL